MNAKLLAVRSYFLSRFFQPLVQKRSYLNILYLLLAFPLGVLYFVVLVTGFALAIGLFITWLSIPILSATFTVAWALSTFERYLAIRLLNVNIPKATPPSAIGQTLFWSRARAYLLDIDTWRRLAYLLAKFPLGVLSFSVAITLIAFTVSLVIAPVIYHNPNFVVGMRVFGWEVDTLEKALLCSILGIGVGVVSIFVTNGSAFISGQFACLMLGSTRHIQGRFLTEQAG